MSLFLFVWDLTSLGSHLLEVSFILTAGANQKHERGASTRELKVSGRKKPFNHVVE